MQFQHKNKTYLFEPYWKDLKGCSFMAKSGESKPLGVFRLFGSIHHLNDITKPIRQGDCIELNNIKMNLYGIMVC